LSLRDDDDLLTDLFWASSDAGLFVCVLYKVTCVPDQLIGLNLSALNENVNSEDSFVALEFKFNEFEMVESVIDSR
jgi:hypothetical protein